MVRQPTISANVPYYIFGSTHTGFVLTSVGSNPMRAIYVDQNDAALIPVF